MIGLNVGLDCPAVIRHVSSVTAGHGSVYLFMKRKSRDPCHASFTGGMPLCDSRRAHDAVLDVLLVACRKNRQKS
jgi:hypothetical protein